MMIKFVTDEDLSAEVAAQLRFALEMDHPGGCGPSCDIDVARDNGYLLAAAWLLRGATETPHLAVVLERQPWQLSLKWWQQETGWRDHHRTFGVKCDNDTGGCGSYTYGDTDALPTTCGGCNATLPAPHWHVEYGVEHWEPLVADLGTVYAALGVFLQDRADLEYPKITALADAGDPAAGIEAFRRWDAWPRLSRLLIAATADPIDSHRLHMNTPHLMAAVNDPDQMPPGVRVWRCHDDECAPSPWDCSEERFWGPVWCEVLFGLFENSAIEPRDGTPLVPVDTVMEHIKECSKCNDADTRISEDVNGVATLEWSAPVDDED